MKLKLYFHERKSSGRAKSKKCDFIRIFGIFNIFVRAPPSHLWTDLEDSFTVRELSNHRFCAVHLLSRSDFIRRSYTEKNAILCHFSVFSISSNGHHRVIYKPIWTIPSPLESSRITDSTRYTFCSDPTSSRWAISKKRYFVGIFGIFTNIFCHNSIRWSPIDFGPTAFDFSRQYASNKGLYDIGQTISSFRYDDDDDGDDDGPKLMLMPLPP